MIPALLTAPIDYEQFYASADSDEAQRFAALSTVIKRLQDENVGWLKDGIHSVHLIDWDWRSESRKYNHRHVPMTILTSEIYDWYRDYGIFVHQAFEERAQRFSLARFFFELTPRRDMVVIRFDLSGKSLFKVDREDRRKTEAEQADDPGAVFTPETVTIRVNHRRALEICQPLGGLLTAFRNQYPPAHRPELGDIIMLADTIGDLEEPVSRLLAASGEAKAAVDAYKAMPERALETFGDDPKRLLHGEDALPAELAPSVTLQDIRVLLANLAVHAYLVPDSLRDSRIAIVPGIAQIEDGKPMAAGGFLLHYEGNDPYVPLQHWLLLATTWAREKAAFDLVERNRREQFGHYMHSISNTFGAVVHDVRALSPTHESQRVARRLEELQSFMLSATTLARGETKNHLYVLVPAGDFLSTLIDDSCEGLAGNTDFVANLFGQSVSPDVAIKSIRKVIDAQEVGIDTANTVVQLWKQMASGIFVDLLKNAIEHTPWSVSDAPPVDISFGVDEIGLYVEISNTVSQGALSRVQQIAAALSRQREPRSIGIGLKDVRNKCLIMQLPLPAAKVFTDARRVLFRAYLAKRETAK